MNCPWWILCHDYQRLSGLGFQNHIMNHITSPSQNKDTSTSTTIIRKGSGTKSRLNPHKLGPFAAARSDKRRLGPCTLQVEAAQERHFGLKFLICVWPNQKKWFHTKRWILEGFCFGIRLGYSAGTMAGWINFGSKRRPPTFAWTTLAGITMGIVGNQPKFHEPNKHVLL